MALFHMATSLFRMKRRGCQQVGAVSAGVLDQRSPRDERGWGPNLIKTKPRPTQLIGAIDSSRHTQLLPFRGNTPPNEH